ncbi:MAG: hypothetical protein JO250_14330 [Armatimonadetes bacterium]|nr:hypothetical protein [Armatimonadota bacterium]
MTRLPLPRLLLAAVLGLALTLAANAVACVWIRATLFDTAAFRDGSAALVTLVLPSFAGGLVLGLVARDAALNVAAAAFALFCVVGFLHPLWRVPDVSRHTPVMHYFLYSPLVALAFGALGGWLGGQFATGKFTLEDRQPITPQHLGD